MLMRTDEVATKAQPVQVNSPEEQSDMILYKIVRRDLKLTIEIEIP